MTKPCICGPEGSKALTCQKCGKGVSTFSDRVKEVSDKRYVKILNMLDIKDECETCNYFNPSATDHYLCRIPGYCIDASLSDDIKNHIRQKLGWSSR